MIPLRIRTSTWAANRLKYLKSKTGLTPNILSRIAIVLSLRELKLIRKDVDDLSGQEFNSSTLFGEHQKVYELLFAKYLGETQDDRDNGAIIATHIDNGLHKMMHIKSLQDVAQLT